MRYCIDEHGFKQTAGELEDLARHIQDFISLVQSCRGETGEQIGRWSELYSCEVLPGVPLARLLYEADFPGALDRDLRLALAEAINRCVEWDAREPLPVPVHVEVDGEQFVAHTIAFTHAQAGAGRATANLCLGCAGRSGRREVTRGGVTCSLHFVATEAERLPFLREVPEIEDLDEDAYMAHAPHAFPTLYFVAGMAQQFRRFTRPYRDLRAWVTEHLAALNDHFRTIFADHQGEPSKVMAEFLSRCKVDASPESPNTRRNKSAMRERLVLVEGREVWCEWHTKLEPRYNRIHFHPGSPGVAGGRLVVGIFHRHLST